MNIYRSKLDRKTYYRTKNIKRRLNSLAKYLETLW